MKQYCRVNGEHVMLDMNEGVPPDYITRPPVVLIVESSDRSREWIYVRVNGP